MPDLLNEVETSQLRVCCTGHEESQVSEHNLHCLCAEQGAAWNFDGLLSMYMI